ncbi:hypothetical protein PPERSA_06148 [Pseudocohnilembus persalinus]|uniref:Uncharacterized protein n=1 Tax=Pseudocohnilembus persalinus TaxID=266149 RepID=A0A0V0QE62_PSEPJ|nr:hypothetical protein PPERSA_06148 [Pseudocohnilembus persalinus]|eukprot:KRX00505.1 hypothetical protein PPERSA_06148 [Pseudocohnilembus persalinus]
MEEVFEKKMSLDKEQEEKEEQPEILEFNFDLKEKLQTEILFVGLFGLGNLFIQSKIKKISQKIGNINFDRRKQRALADIYKTEKGQIALLFNEEVPVNKDYNLSDSLKNYIEYQQILILDQFHENHFDTRHKKEISQNLRVVSSSLAKQSNQMEIADQLEVGIPVKGLAADLLMGCEYDQKLGQLYLGIVQEYEYNLESLNVFNPILKLYTQLDNKTDVQEVKKDIKKYNNQRFSTGIYI